MQNEWEVKPADYYKILQVDASAEAEVIEAAYKRLCHKYHPDKQGGSGEKMRDINNAYETLKDAPKRRLYDGWYRDRYGKETSSAALAPKPEVVPATLRFDDIVPHTPHAASFIVRNAGGNYDVCKIVPASRDPFVKITEFESLSTEDLPLRVHIEVEGRAWGASATEYIIVRLDAEEARVSVQMNTKPLTMGVILMNAGRSVVRTVRGWKFPRPKISRKFIPSSKAVVLVILMLSGIWGMSKFLGSGFEFSRDLTNGMRGGDVSELQRQLASAGMYSGSITGYFGDVTEESVKAYQRKKGIDPTGYVGPVTRAVLNGEAPSSTKAGSLRADSEASSSDAAATIPTGMRAAVVATLADEKGAPALDAVFKNTAESGSGYLPHITIIDTDSGDIVWSDMCAMRASCSFGDPKTGILKTSPLPVGSYRLKITIPGKYGENDVVLAERDFALQGNQNLYSLGTLTLIGIPFSP